VKSNTIPPPPSYIATVYRVPAVLAVITLCGLIVALFDDGLLDTVAWCALALPVAVVLVAMLTAHCSRVDPDA
jgi:hypothetical protein